MMRFVVGSSFTARRGLSTLPPFHLAFPVNDLEKARDFYAGVMGLPQGREAPGKWIDFNLKGHQIVAHFVGKQFEGRNFRWTNPVDSDEVPVPHFGLCFSLDDFHDLAERFKKAKVQFVIEPHLRFKGQPGEQWTCFLHDPSGNSLEFKAMTNPENLFTRYSVVDD